MKKILLASAVFSVALMAGAPSFAIDSTGCGLGSMAWRGQSGMVPQVLAVTTNGLFGSQTFGITTGTSGCDPEGRITGGTQRMLLAFVENNMEQIAMDVAAGNGETLETMAGIMNVDAKTLASKTHNQFAVLFPSADVEAVDVTLKLFEIMKA